MTDGHDVFVSFKSLDDQGLSTPDAALAKQVHDFLTARHLRVFCANVSLEQLGVSAYKKAIDQALDTSQVLVAVGTTSENLASEWVRYEWDSFFSDVLSGIKPEGRVFVYAKGIPLMTLPRALRQSQVLNDGPDSMQRLFNFVTHALGHRSVSQESVPAQAGTVPLTVADAQRRLEMYAKEHDDVFNILWDSSNHRFDIELNGSSEWPSENRCNQALLDELAKPWPVYRWYSD